MRVTVGCFIKSCLRLMPLALILAFIVSIIGPSIAYANPGWYTDASWHYRKKITINAANVTANLANFPVMISITSDGALGTHAQLDGDDILFTAADEFTKLSHEIEKYSSNGVTANLTAWVMVPSLSSVSDTDIYMYYGNAGAANQQAATSVWDSNFKMVQHLEETSGGTNAIKDSTGYNNNGTDNHSPTFGTTGKIDGAITFNKASNQYIQLPASNSILNADNFTLESWIITTTNHPPYGSGDMEGRILNLHRGATVGSAVSLYVELNKVGLFYHNGTTSFQLTYTVNYYDGVPHNLAATHSSIDSTYRLYYDGVQVASAIDSFVGFGTYPGFIATHNGTERSYNGTLDEARISNSVRSAAWIKTSFNNQNNPAAFFTLGAEANNFVAPTVTTIAATLVEETTATVSGNITNTGGVNANIRGFEWDIDSGAPYSTNWTESGSYGTGVFSHGLTSLSQGTLYYFRALAHNSAGWGYGSENEFLTKPDEPNTFAATPGNQQVQLTWAKGSGAQNTTIRGKIGSYPTSYNTDVAVYSGIGTTVTHSGLNNGDHWYYRAWSYTTDGGLEQYSDLYVQIDAIPVSVPTVTTNDATLVEEQTARLNGTLDSDGGELCQYSFEWGTAPGVYTANISWTGSITTGQTFSTNLIGLIEGQPYYYRAKVINSISIAYGGEIHFLTKPDGPVVLNATANSSSQIDLSWTKGTGADRTKVMRKLGGYPTDYDDGTEVYFGTGTSFSDTGLSANTTYYYRGWSEVTGSQQWSNTFVSASATTLAAAPTPPTVIGGKVFSVNKTMILAPWLLLAAALSLLIIRVVTYFRKKSLSRTPPRKNL